MLNKNCVALLNVLDRKKISPRRGWVKSFAIFWCQSRDGDELHWTVRCQVWVLLSGFVSLAWRTALKSMLLGLLDFAWLSRVLQPKQNFFNHLVTVRWSIAPLPFTQQIFWVVSVVLWLSLNLESRSSQIRLCCKFISVAFKSHTEWSNAQYINTTTSMILLTTAWTAYVIYLLQTSTYPNIAKLWTHPSIFNFKHFFIFFNFD